MTTETKTCAKCKETKSFNCFNNNSATIDGKCSQCRHCMVEVRIAYEANHKKEKTVYQKKAYQETYNAKHKAEIAAYRAEHINESVAYQQSYYERLKQEARGHYTLSIYDD